MATPHGRGHITLEQLALPGLHDREPHAPDSASQQVHAEQSGDQKVDVARPRRDRAIVPHRNAVLPSPRALQGVVHLESGEPTLGAGRVIAIDNRIAGDDEQRDPATAQPKACGRGIEHDRDQTWRRIERRRERAVAAAGRDADLQLARSRVAKREAEGECEHDRESEHPEDGFGLAIKLAHARERQLKHRMLTNHGAAVL